MTLGLGHRYTPKNIDVYAIQWTGHNVPDVRDFARGRIHLEHDALLVHTADGVQLANTGDYIVRGLLGDYYICSEQQFINTHDPVGSDWRTHAQ